jgi:hypothetical protein
MQTYLKTKPVWIQLFLFLGMAFGILMVFFMIGGLLLTQLTGINLIELGNSADWKPGDPAMKTALRGMIALQFLGLFLIPSLLFGYFSDPRPAQYLGLRKPSNSIYWILGILALLVSIPLVEYTGVLNRQLPVGSSTYKSIQGMEEDATRTIQYMLGGRSLTNLILNLIFIAVFAGVGEELFFRGVLQRLLIKAFKSPWVGIIVAALAFSFFHFQFFGFIPRLLLGILLGAIYWYSGSLWPAILAHFFYDALFILIAYNNPGLIEKPDATLFQNTSTLAVSAAGSAAVTALIVWGMKRYSTASYDAVYADDNPAASSENDLSF